MTLSYFDIQRFCIHDGPGIRTTVFLKGCPLNCLWCHNPESKRTGAEVMLDAQKCVSCLRCVGFCNARSVGENGHVVYNRSLCSACGKCAERCFNSAIRICGKQATVGELLEQIERDKPFYQTSGGGMTVSGGEPALQAQGVLELVGAARAQGIPAAIETCGFGNRDFFARLCELGCLFLYDIKGIDPEKHKANTGVYPQLIHDNLDMLLDMGAHVILRLPIIPGKNDSVQDLELLASFLAKRRGKIEYAEIMPYHSLGVGKSKQLGIEADDTIPDGRALAQLWQESLSKSGVSVHISGK